MSVDRSKAIVRRLFEVWNTGKLEKIEELRGELCRRLSTLRAVTTWS